MATEDNSTFIKSQEGRHDIISALSSAILEWLLMFMLFIDACFSYSITRFARYCKLQVPCLLCSRLDHSFGNVKHNKFYWDLICGNHKLEISSLVFCRMHNKLGDVNGMCENCLFSFATIDKSNAETYRLLVGKMGAGDTHELDDDPFFADREYGPRRCSCCNGVWTSKIHTASPPLSTTKSARLDHTELDALLSVNSEYDLKKKKIGEETTSRSFKSPLMMRKNSFDPPLYDAGYSKVKITSDTESEDMIHENGDDEHQIINFDHDLDLEKKKIGGETTSRSFKASLMRRKSSFDPPLYDAGYTKVNITSDTESEDGIHENGDDEHQIINFDHDLGLENEKIGDEINSRSFKAPLMMRKSSFDPPLYDEGYTKVNITSDTESEDVIHENGDDDHQNVNFNNDLGLERLIHLDSLSELNQMVHSQVVLVDVDNSVTAVGHVVDNSVTAVGHGLEELNWSQDEQKRDDESSTKNWKHFDEKWPSPDIIAILCQEGVTTTTSTLEQKVDYEDEVVSEIETSPKMNHVAGDVEQNSGDENEEISKLRDSQVVRIETFQETNIVGGETSQLFPNDLELGDAYKLAIANKSRQLSGKFLQQVSQKESTRVSEDLKLLLFQMSSNRGSEPPPYDTSPRVSVVSRRSLERNESGLSLDGSVVGEIEGENEIDRLKRQAEHDKRIMNALYKELEEERNASAVAANQAMAMITKLQEDKAAVHMEALQCIRVMEEQAEYDVEALNKTNELLTDKEKEVQDLEEEIEYYRIKFGDISMMEEDELGLASDDVIIPSQERLYILQNLRKLENKLVLLSHDGIEENNSDNSRSFSKGVASGNSTRIDVVSLVDDISSLIGRLEMEKLKGTHSSLETSVSSFCRRDEALKIHPDDGLSDVE